MKKIKNYNTKQAKFLQGIEQKKSNDVSQCSQVLSNYQNGMEKLFQNIQVNKIRKIIKDIKSINPSFRQYLNENRINVLKFDDVLKFQNIYLKNHNENVKRSNHKYFDTLEEIREGFIKMKKRLQQLQVSDFETQMKYCSSIINRQIEKLQNIGQQYQGIHLIRNPNPLAKQIQQDERQNGKYELLNKNLIQKTAILQETQIKFKAIILER